MGLTYGTLPILDRLPSSGIVGNGILYGFRTKSLMMSLFYERWIEVDVTPS
jgi:hypothetical protein